MGVEYQHFLIPEDNTYKPRPGEFCRLVEALAEGGFVSQFEADTIRGMTPDLTSTDCDTGKVCCYARLRNGRQLWFPCPCSEVDIAALEEQDFQVVWSVESSGDSGLKYPLVPFPEWGDPYYDLELHVAGDFVYHNSELIDPFNGVACTCGKDLCYSEWWEPSGAELVAPDPASGRYNSAMSHQPPRLPLYTDDRIHRICPNCGRLFRPQDWIARVRDGYTGEASRRAGGATYLFAVVVDCGKGFARKGWPIRATEEFRDTVTQALGHEFYEIGDVY